MIIKSKKCIGWLVKAIANKYIVTILDFRINNRLLVLYKRLAGTLY